LKFRGSLKLIGAFLSGAIVYSLIRKLFDDLATTGSYIPIPVTPDRPVLDALQSNVQAQEAAALSITATGNFPVPVNAANVRLEPFEVETRGANHSNAYLRIKRKKNDPLNHMVSMANPPRNIDANTVEVTVLVTETVAPGTVIVLDMYCEVPDKYRGFAIVRKS